MSNRTIHLPDCLTGFCGKCGIKAMVYGKYCDEINGGKDKMLTEIQRLEIKVKEIGLFFLANSGRLAEAVEKLDMEEELETLLISFKQILEDEN